MPELQGTPLAPSKRPPLPIKWPPLFVIGQRNDRTRDTLINQLWAWLERQPLASGQIILIDGVKVVVARTQQGGPLVMVYAGFSDLPPVSLYAKSGVQRCRLLTTSILLKLVQQL